jgi:peptide/nickel transport system ATP-binding protein
MAGTEQGTPARDDHDVLLRVEDLVVEFPVGRTGLKVNAVSGISFDVLRARRSGSSASRAAARAPPARRSCSCPAPRAARSCSRAPSSPTAARRRDARGAHPHADDLPGPDLVAQPAPQGPPDRRRAAQDLEARHEAERSTKVDEMLEEVGIDPVRAGESQPHQFSGGQCQRISIARALVLDPKLIICDEPVSALDVSVQAQVLNLLEDLKARYGLTLIFIAHDLAVVKNISDRIAVMYLGKMCEVAPSDVLYESPAHHYTSVLLNSIPVPDPDPRSRSCARSARATSWPATSRSTAARHRSPCGTDATALRAGGTLA